ncbi:transporter substrate-binding domain-containing protein [Alteromonas sp. KUL49]|uniref:substrate-binding periplasmic protein n=1 Tax=Alteromonas sp. KUL49 TaxID=2480798 RepID=UPI00102F2B94|nr:transporter substrate-binding domain-containing protein [Alteromonas sp. KUL49]TAP41476.1 transporter substrate-binding domain-containing protein [Alteromonas sp. KUL49]GEA10563.1 hypothetical protein KUL49_09380 [Alteromonas sp. KUL49]
MFRSYTYWVFYLTLTFAAFTEVNAVEGECKKTLVVSVAQEWPPFSYLEDDEFKGLDIEIVELVLRNANYCWNYVYYPSSTRSLIELKKGNVDLIFAASYTSERADYAFYSEAYRFETMQLFGRIGQIAKSTLEAGSTIAVNRGSHYGNDFERYRQECEECIVDTNTASERFALVDRGRVDFAIEESIAGDYIIDKAGLTGSIVPTSVTINRSPVHFMLSKKQLTFLELDHLNQVIGNSHNEINSIVIKYHQRYGN